MHNIPTADAEMVEVGVGANFEEKSSDESVRHQAATKEYLI